MVLIGQCDPGAHRPAVGGAAAPGRPLPRRARRARHAARCSAGTGAQVGEVRCQRRAVSPGGDANAAGRCPVRAGPRNPGHAVGCLLVAVQVGAPTCRRAHGTRAPHLVVLLLAPECSLPIRRVGAAYHASVPPAWTSSAEVAELPNTSRHRPTARSSAVPGAPALHPAGPQGRRSRPRTPGRTGRPGRPSSSRGKSSLVGGSERGRQEHPARRGPTVRCAWTAGEITIAGIPVSELHREARTAVLAWIPQGSGSPGPGRRGLGPGWASMPVVPPRSTGRSTRWASPRWPGGLPDQLSGGELQRLAVARALVRARSGQVRFLLADEPTAHLDPTLVERVAHELRAVAANGVGVLVITHDHRLTDVADRVVAIPLDVAEPGTADRAWDVAAPPVHPLPDRPARLATIGLALPDPAPEPVSPSGDNGSGPLGDLAWFRHIGRHERSRLMAARALGAAAEASHGRAGSDRDVAHRACR